MSNLSNREEQLIIVSNELGYIKKDIHEIKQGLHDHMEEEEGYRKTLNRKIGILAILVGMNLLGIDGHLALTLLPKMLTMFI